MARKKKKEFKLYAAWLIIINTAILILEGMIPSLIPLFALYPPELLQRPWTLFTSMFLHSGLEHLIYNMFALGLFGIVLESLIGSKKFLSSYLVTGIAAGIATLVIYPMDYSLGASGAIYGIIGLLTVLRPKMMIYFAVPLPMLFYAAVYIFFDIVGLFTGVNPDNIAYAAHLAGFFAGVLIGLYYKDEFAEEKEIKRQVDLELDDEDLDRWERKYM